MVPARLDVSAIVHASLCGPSDAVRNSSLPEHVFAFKNRILLLHEIEKAINLTSSSLVVSFGAHHCGYCGAIASRLQGVEHGCVFTYRDIFEFHLNSPQEFEVVSRASRLTASFSERAVRQVQVFQPQSACPPFVLEPVEPSDLVLFTRAALKFKVDDSATTYGRYILTCGSISSLNDIGDLVTRANRHLGDGCDRWIHAGVLGYSILAPFCAHLASAGLLDRFSVQGVLERAKLLSTLKRATIVLLSRGEHDTGILERECALMGIPVDVPNDGGSPASALDAPRFDGVAEEPFTRLSITEFLQRLSA